MKLVFYSGGQQEGNRRLHQELVDLTGKRSRASLTYVPFCSDGAEIYFRRAVKRYQKFGVSSFHCLALDGQGALDAADVRRALNSDIIYLAGGNTFYFLKYLRKRKLFGALRSYVEQGGVLAGLSAGAHIMTPHIGLAGLRGLDPDKNEVGLQELGALHLVDFEFMPHFFPNERKLRLLQAYSRKSKRAIYGCADGGGIVIDGNRFSLYGRSCVFYMGDCVQLT